MTLKEYDTQKDHQVLKEYSESLEEELIDARQENTTAIILAFLIGAGITAAILFTWGCP